MARSGQRTASLAIGLGYGHVASSLLIVFPLFLFYEIGLLLTPGTNGVDFVSRALFALVGRDVSKYVFLHLGLGAIYLGLLAWLHRRNRLSLEYVTPLVLESAIYALTLGSFIVFVMDRMVGLDLFVIGFHRLSLHSAQLGSALVISLGAGVHEELVFRLGLMGVGGWLLMRLGLERRLAIIIAVVVSSVAFAIAHHLGAAGEAFEVSVFTYRLIAGLAFSAIFYYRSLAHAVYCHFLYDLYVLALAK